jgi:hypothetical protein
MTEELINSVHMLYLENYIARKLSYEKYVSEHVVRKKKQKKEYFINCVLCSMYSHMFSKNKRFYLTFCTFSLNLKKFDTRCLIQDVVSPHCGDKRMA